MNSKHFIDYSVNHQPLRFVPILASNITDGELVRKQRQILFTIPDVPIRARWAGGEGYACITSRGILGSCQPFMKCYPYFKAPTHAVRFPVLNAWDTWVLGNHDTCNYYTNDGREAHGVCCTNPISSTSPVEVEGNEQNKINLPVVQSVQNWPPQSPTHPPDHAAPTHPPSHFGVQNTGSTMRPTIRPTTTWATRPPPPVFGVPVQTTTKRPVLFRPTTESPIINEVAFDGFSCGGKNGFQVRQKSSSLGV